jgi:hypothetical protein
MTRDKSTLIFKYQNNTAFLPCEVVELKRQNVDINPDYTDSLDAELFTVHLMFEKPTAETAAAAASEALPETDSSSAEGDFGRSNSVLPVYTSYSNMQGGTAFDRGLEEICKYHFVEPDPLKVTALQDMGFPGKFAPPALRLANNSLDNAAELVKLMKKRAADLERDSAKGGGTVGRSPGGTSPSPGSGSSVSYSAAGADLIVGSSASSQRYQSAGGSSVSDTLLSDRVIEHVYSPRSPTSQRPPGEVDSRPVSLALTGSHADNCPVCGKEDATKEDQLIPCTGSCRRHYHTFCLGQRRIPFTLKTEKERQNREKYINKHYGTWVCTACGDSRNVAIGASAVLSQISARYIYVYIHI